MLCSNQLLPKGEYFRGAQTTLPTGEYLIRLRDRSHCSSTRLWAEILEGDYDGHRVDLRLAPSVKDHFRASAKRGACWMAYICMQGAMNVVTRLAFLGYEHVFCESIG
jgi:hypothetical protein